MLQHLLPTWTYAAVEKIPVDGPVVQAHNLSAAATPQGPCILHQLNFSIQRHQHTALVGPNGSGKSTLLRLLAGLITPQTGSLQVLGATPRRGRPAIAYLAQNLQLTPNFPLCVRDLVAMGTYSRLGWLKPKQAKDDRVEQALATLALQSIAQRDVHQISGGQLQRALLARALAQQATLLLLDEPFVGLDRGSRAIIEEFLFQSTPAFTVVMATHDSADLHRCAQTIALRDGEIQSGGGYHV